MVEKAEMTVVAHLGPRIRWETECREEKWDLIVALYCSNKSIDTPDPSVKRVIIVIHGTNRNANTYFSEMMSAVNAAGSTDSLVIAPWFTTSSDTSEVNVILWTSEGWKSGDDSETSPKISSYAAVDELIKHVANKKKFPNLQRVIVTGHSAGGQFTARFAVGTQIDHTLASPGLSFRFIIANPSSYLYFTPERPVPGNPNQFAVPSAGKCSDYDTYKYGINGMNPYMSAVSVDQLKNQFKDRNVIYLLGEQDTDPNDSSIDKSCAGEAQGAFRLERGTAYYNYIGKIFGASVYKNHIKALVPGVAHDGNAMYNSAVAAQYLFDKLFRSTDYAPTLMTNPENGPH